MPRRRLVLLAQLQHREGVHIAAAAAAACKLRGDGKHPLIVGGQVGGDAGSGLATRADHRNVEQYRVALRAVMAQDDSLGADPVAAGGEVSRVEREAAV